jgi:hypothetical protein
MAGPLLVILLAVALRLGFTADAAASRHGHARDLVPGSAGPHAAPRLARRARATQASPAANWISSWGASPQGPSANNLSGQGFRFQTLRQIVSTSIGGSRVRIELSNAYGTRPLLIGGAAIAVQQSGAGLAAGTARQLTFGGQNSLLVPPGAEALSDPVTLPVKPLQRLAVSLYLPVRTGPATEHADAEETSFLAAGDRLSQLTAAGFSRRTGSWYYLDGVDVLAPRRELGAVVALGDSITDGVGSTPGGENRWPDYLARRLDARPGSSLAVVNEGIGGNRVLNDALCCGAGAVARFARDVRGRAGAREVILLEGVNDIGFSGHTGRLTAPHTSVSPAEIIAGDQQLVAQAHAAHLRIFPRGPRSRLRQRRSPSPEPGGLPADGRGDQPLGADPRRALIPPISNSRPNSNASSDRCSM